MMFETTLVNMACSLLLRRPEKAELDLLIEKNRKNGLENVVKELEAWRVAEGVADFTRSQILDRILTTFTFYQQDMGCLNEIADTDIIIISGPKSGTTTLSSSFRQSGHKTFVLHNDGWLRKYMPNGSILKYYDITFVEVFKHLQPNNPLLILGFREPVSWYFALAGELRLSMDASLVNRMPSAILDEYPWNALAFEKSVAIYEEILGCSLVELPFDKNVGYAEHKGRNYTAFTYRLDSLDHFLDHLDYTGILSKRQLSRVNNSHDYINLIGNLNYNQDDISHLYNSKLVKYFYNDYQVKKYLNSYCCDVEQVLK